MGGFFFDFEVIRTASSDRDAPRRYHMMGHRHAYDAWRTVDAFDYAVEHLSMYERMMHASKSGKDKGSALGDVLYGTFVDNLAKYEQRLKAKCGGDDPALRRQKRFTDAERTVGVMPFYAAISMTNSTPTASKR